MFYYLRRISEELFPEICFIHDYMSAASCFQYPDLLQVPSLTVLLKALSIESRRSFGACCHFLVEINDGHLKLV